ncbi:MAG TPA: OmpA family protein, partial [Polyangiaceae bacterium]|nr:OmpA family protein [Polyangiaceae bacterium]
MQRQLERHYSFLALVLAPGGLLACSFTAQATGSVDSGGDARGQTSSEVESRTPAPAPAPAAAAATTAPAIELKQGRLEYRGVINFEYDRAALRDDSDTTRTLSEFRKFLQEHPDVALEIEGHTDSRGSAEYNLDLSERRAASVKDWLIGQGIDASRLSAVGKGEGDPQLSEPEVCRDAAQEDVPACEDTWATNRRVVFEVTRGEETISEPPPPPPPP